MMPGMVPCQYGTGTVASSLLCCPTAAVNADVPRLGKYGIAPYEMPFDVSLGAPADGDADW